MMFLSEGTRSVSSFDYSLINNTHMTKTMYDVISPDGFPISCEPFNTQEEAVKYAFQWCKRYEQQGYYSTSRWEKIPLEDLPENLDLVPVTVNE